MIVKLCPIKSKVNSPLKITKVSFSPFSMTVVVHCYKSWLNTSRHIGQEPQDLKHPLVLTLTTLASTRKSYLLLYKGHGTRHDDVTLKVPKDLLWFHRLATMACMYRTCVVQVEGGVRVQNQDKIWLFILFPASFNSSSFPSHRRTQLVRVYVCLA